MNLFDAIDSSYRLKLIEPPLILLGEDHKPVEKYSWKDYFWYADYIAYSLEYFGAIQPGRDNFVAALLLNIPESFFALLGIIAAGAVPVPLNIKSLRNERGIEELKNILDDCRPGLAVVSDELMDDPQLDLLREKTDVEFRSVASLKDTAKQHECEGLIEICRGFECNKTEDDVLIMPYTSGTESGSKGVMLSHGNIVSAVEAAAVVFGAGPHDSLLSYLPLGHISELVATFFGQLYAGYTVYFSEYSKYAVCDTEKFTANLPGAWKAAEPTIFLAVPLIWQGLRGKIEHQLDSLPVPLPRFLAGPLIKNKLGFNQTRYFISSAAELEGTERDYFKKLGINIVDVYGQTEAAGPVLADGCPVDPQNTRVVVDDATKEILISGPPVMKGYFNDKQADARAFESRKINEEEIVFYRTGDFGVKTPDGRILYDGRKSYGFKLANGEFVSGSVIKRMEGRIKSLSRSIDEVVIYRGEGKNQIAVLVFTRENKKSSKYKNLKLIIAQALPQVGEEGLYRIKGFSLLSSDKLVLTSTLKVVRKETLNNCREELEQIYIREEKK